MGCKEFKLTQITSKCSRTVLRENEGDTYKVQGRAQVKKGRYKTKKHKPAVPRMFIDSDSHLTLWNYPARFLTEGRSRSAQIMWKFQINIFTQKCVPRSKFPQDSKYVISALLRCDELRENHKNDVITFRYIEQIPFTYRALVSFVVTAFWFRVTTK